MSTKFASPLIIHYFTKKGKCGSTFRAGDEAVSSQLGKAGIVEESEGKA